MAKMRYCIAQPAPKKTSNIQMRWSVQDPLSPMLWSTTNSLPVYTYGKNICWCIHSVVPHLGIVKESILNTNKPGAVFLGFFFFFRCTKLPQHVCINCSSCHPPLKNVPFAKINCKSALSMSLIDIVAPFFTGDTGDR